MERNELPFFFKEKKSLEIIKEVISQIPKGTNIYVVGGRVRSALYYKFFKKRFPQRDYDLIVIGDFRKFIYNLKKREGFVEGEIQRKNQVVLKKQKISSPKKLSDYVVLDIQRTKEKTIKSNLKKNANFTFNANAINLKDFISERWSEKIISLPNAIKDLKSKKIKINSLSHPANLFAVIRFMHLGFKEPKRKEVLDLLKDFKRLEEDRLERNIDKVFSYVGSERRAMFLAKKLKLPFNIFNKKEVYDLKI